MKKYLLLALVTFGSAVFAQSGAKIEFKDKDNTIDYGTVNKEDDNGLRAFVFTNTGNAPLIIKDAKSTCGCTVPSFPKEPIAPGAKGVIGVKYDTNRVGPFTKTVTISSNAAGQPTKVLTIKGNVIASSKS